MKGYISQWNVVFAYVKGYLLMFAEWSQVYNLFFLQKFFLFSILLPLSIYFCTFGQSIMQKPDLCSVDTLTEVFWDSFWWGLV